MRYRLCGLKSRMERHVGGNNTKNGLDHCLERLEISKVVPSSNPRGSYSNYNGFQIVGKRLIIDDLMLCS